MTATKATPAASKPKATAKPAPKPSPCKCGCGTMVAHRFSPGHDARHASNLRKAVEAGTMTPAAAQAKADLLSTAFSRKVARSLELVAARKAAEKANDK